jgi:DNA-binding Lrp family transcriptional regulator
MAKSSAEQIDQDEKNIIKELRTNANKSVNDIAKNLGFSRQKVWRTIKKLEKNKTIWGYSAVLDEHQLGKKSYLLLIKRSNKPISRDVVEKMARQNFMKRIEKIGIESLGNIYMNGLYDWLIHFNADDIKTAKNYVEELNRTYGDYISNITLQEIIYTAQISGITNPNIKQIKDFFRI